MACTCNTSMCPSPLCVFRPARIWTVLFGDESTCANERVNEFPCSTGEFAVVEANVMKWLFQSLARGDRSNWKLIINWFRLFCANRKWLECNYASDRYWIPSIFHMAGYRRDDFCEINHIRFVFLSWKMLETLQKRIWEMSHFHDIYQSNWFLLVSLSTRPTHWSVFGYFEWQCLANATGVHSPFHFLVFLTRNQIWFQ